MIGCVGMLGGEIYDQLRFMLVGEIYDRLCGAYDWLRDMMSVVGLCSLARYDRLRDYARCI